MLPCGREEVSIIKGQRGARDRKGPPLSHAPASRWDRHLEAESKMSLLKSGGWLTNSRPLRASGPAHSVHRLQDIECPSVPCLHRLPHLCDARPICRQISGSKTVCTLPSEELFLTPPLLFLFASPLLVEDSFEKSSMWLGGSRGLRWSWRRRIQRISRADPQARGLTWGGRGVFARRLSQNVLDLSPPW